MVKNEGITSANETKRQKQAYDKKDNIIEILCGKETIYRDWIMKKRERYYPISVWERLPHFRCYCRKTISRNELRQGVQPL